MCSIEVPFRHSIWVLLLMKMDNIFLFIIVTVFTVTCFSGDSEVEAQVVEKSCFASTSSNVTYFVGPGNYTGFCPFRVDAADSSVCQLRLDFEEFVLAQPSWESSSQSSSLMSVLCSGDRFTITDVFSPLGFQYLCGINTGQHIYIPLNQSESVNSATLTFHLESYRPANYYEYKGPSWRIKVTQIYCGSCMSSAEQAPPGCLQYYTDTTGTYQSFNYLPNRGGTYLSGLDYAICFKRTSQDCSISHNLETLGLYSTDPNIFNATDVRCMSSNNLDYLYIPDGAVSSQVRVSVFCGYSSDEELFVQSKSPGPFFTAFHSGTTRELAESWGFKFHYKISIC